MRIKLLLLCLIGALLLPTLASAEQPVRVQVVTSKGRFIMELYPDKAPKTVENFLTYARNGYYDGTIFHRVIETFMIQGGGFTEQLSRKGPTLPPIMNEADNGLSNERYSVSMARTNDPHSATAQFFINTRNNIRLDYTAPHGAGWGYCVFGKVLTGQTVIDEISKVRVKNPSPMFQNVPTTPVIIQKVVVIE